MQIKIEHLGSIEVEVGIDGDQFCIQGVGWNFATHPAGFGSTIPEAVQHFKSEVLNTYLPKRSRNSAD